MKFTEGQKVDGKIRARDKHGDIIDGIIKDEKGTVIDTLYGQGIGGADLLRVEIDETTLLQLWFLDGTDKITLRK